MYISFSSNCWGVYLLVDWSQLLKEGCCKKSGVAGGGAEPTQGMYAASVT